MISEFLMKSIDSLFSKGCPTPIDTNVKQFNREIIRANLQSVVKEAPRQPKPENDAEGGLNKSRLRMILEKNKDAQIKSVIRRDNSRSTSPYQRISISPIGKVSPTKGEAGDRIAYYREQRKTIEKSRVLEKSRLGSSNSRIFRVGSQLKMAENATKKESPTFVQKNSIRY